MSNLPPPSPGDEIYVPTAWYLSRGRDDVQGGKATVERLKRSYGTLWVYVKELPGRGHNWEIIGPDQEKLKAEFGESRAHPDPDDDPSANTGRL